MAEKSLEHLYKPLDKSVGIVYNGFSTHGGMGWGLVCQPHDFLLKFFGLLKDDPPRRHLEMKMKAMRFAPSIKNEMEEYNMPEDQLSALEAAKMRLHQDGIDLGECWEDSIQAAILITEAVNWAAKTIDWEYYTLKPRCIEECWAKGAEGGWRDGIFYLYHPDVGVASFHDPNDEIGIDCRYRWLWEWSGIPRQNLAFDLLVDRKTLLYMKFCTAPGDLGEWVRSWAFQARPRNKLP